VLDLLFPLACAGCGARATAGAPVCRRCAAALRPAPADEPPAGVDEWLAPFAYEGVARELVARVKYRDLRAVVPWIAACMADVAATARVHADSLTWAPTTPARRRSRGFDPAEALARAVGRRAGRPAMRLLVRAPGLPQTGLPAAARRVGPRFTARARAPACVLVVDDIATTGATLAAAARALRAAGATRIVALTAARTPRPDNAPSNTPILRREEAPTDARC
jgi:predicted amidophosphoribosyltransferase